MEMWAPSLHLRTRIHRFKYVCERKHAREKARARAREGQTQSDKEREQKLPAGTAAAMRSAAILPVSGVSSSASMRYSNVMPLISESANCVGERKTAGSKQEKQREANIKVLVTEILILA